MNSPKIIQILSHNGQLLALSDDGKIYSIISYMDVDIWSETYLSIKESDEIFKELTKEIINA